MSDDEPTPIVRTKEFAIEIGDHVLHIETCLGTDRIAMYLTWRDKDSIKHYATVDKLEFTNAMKELSE